MFEGDRDQATNQRDARSVFLAHRLSSSERWTRAERSGGPDLANAIDLLAGAESNSAKVVFPWLHGLA